MTLPASVILRNTEVIGSVLCQIEDNTVFPKLAPPPQENPENSKELVLEKSYEEGYQAGKEIALQEGRQSLQTSLEALNAVISALNSRKEELFEALRPEIITLCLAVCENILTKTLEKPSAVVKVVEKVLDYAAPLVKDACVDVFLSPQDFESLKEPLTARFSKDKHVSFVPDASIRKGACRLETPLGLVNVDISRILADLKTKLLEAQPLPSCSSTPEQPC